MPRPSSWNAWPYGQGEPREGSARGEPRRDQGWEGSRKPPPLRQRGRRQRPPAAPATRSELPKQPQTQRWRAGGGLVLGSRGVRDLELAGDDTSRHTGIGQTLHTRVGMGCLVLPLTYSGLRTKDEEGLSSDEVSCKGAVGVLERHDEGRLVLV